MDRENLVVYAGSREQECLRKRKVRDGKTVICMIQKRYGNTNM